MKEPSTLYSNDDICSLILKLNEFKIFGQEQKSLDSQNVWERTLRLNTAKYINFKEKICSETVLDYKALFANRLLTYLYEKDLIFLPEKQQLLNLNSDFHKFYCIKYTNECNFLKNFFEKYCFDFLQTEIDISTSWTKSQFIDYFNERVIKGSNLKPAIFDEIDKTTDPTLYIRILLIQHALDFLPEASHMAKCISGDYGVIQSELFKVLIDEYGYGIFEKKHSTLFKKTLLSLGLKNNSHNYWQFYLTSTLMLNNLFHFLTTNKIHFFKYLGAIALSEKAFGPYCNYTAKLIKKYFKEADVKYYLEHVHIDDYHASMTLDILLKTIDLYGKDIIPEIVTGIEWVIYLQQLANKDLNDQLHWQNNNYFYKDIGQKIKDTVKNDIKIKKVDILEPRGELSTTHVHDGDELCLINSGEMEFINGFETRTKLQTGEATIIRKNRLHGALIISNQCNYTIYSIKNYKIYANKLDRSSQN